MLEEWSGFTEPLEPLRKIAVTEEPHIHVDERSHGTSKGQTQSVFLLESSDINIGADISDMTLPTHFLGLKKIL